MSWRVLHTIRNLEINLCSSFTWTNWSFILTVTVLTLLPNVGSFLFVIGSHIDFSPSNLSFVKFSRSSFPILSWARNSSANLGFKTFFVITLKTHSDSSKFTFYVLKVSSSFCTFDVICWFLLPGNLWCSSLGVVIFDIESLTKVLYYLINFWRNGEIFLRFVYVICNTFYST